MNGGKVSCSKPFFVISVLNSDCALVLLESDQSYLLLVVPVANQHTCLIDLKPNKALLSLCS